MFDLIYNYLMDNLLTSTVLPPELMAYNTDLCLIMTHVSIILIYVVLIMALVGIFKLVGGLFKW